MMAMAKIEARRWMAGVALLATLTMLACLLNFVRNIRHGGQNGDAVRVVSAAFEGGIYAGRGDTIFQQHYNDCGPAVMLMVLRDRGITSSLRDLENGNNLETNGISLYDLRRMAEAKGVSAVWWKLSMSDLRQAPLPVILFVHGNHFVEVSKLVNRYLVKVNDPAIGTLYWPTVSLSHAWAGEALIFDPNWKPKD